MVLYNFTGYNFSLGVYAVRSLLQKVLTRNGGFKITGIDLLVVFMVILVMVLALAYYLKDLFGGKKMFRKRPIEEAELKTAPPVEAKIKTPIEQKAAQINEMKAPEPTTKKAEPEVEVLAQIFRDNRTGMPGVQVREGVDILEIYAAGMPFIKAIEERLVEKNYNNIKVQ